MIGHPFQTLEELPHNPNMPKNRIIPVLVGSLLVPLLALAQAGPPQNPPSTSAGAPSSTAPAGQPAAKTEPPTEAEKALDEAIKKVAALKSVSADLTLAVDMLGQRFELRGRYMKGPSYRIYLKLSLVGLGDTSGDMLQVCDGRTLWDFQQILKTDRAYTKLDLSKILNKVDAPDFNAELRKQAIQRIGFAGPESLLTGLRSSLRFYRKDPDTLQGKAMWLLRGEWKDMAALAGPGQPPAPSTAALPPYIPSMAQVWIGQDDGWPYKVALEGRQPSILMDMREIGLDGKPLGAKGTSNRIEISKLLLTNANVQINTELDPNLFAFTNPPDTPVFDGTEQFLISLEQASAALQAEQRNSAAKENELPRSIPIPSPAPEIPSALPKSGISPVEKGAAPSP
jgi:hypothetical protein